MMVIIRGWRRRPFVIEVAATASGGDTIAPVRKARGQVKPGISACATTATLIVVKITSPIAAMLMGRMAALNSCQLVFHDASYKSGGRKRMNTISGLKEITGRPG